MLKSQESGEIGRIKGARDFSSSLRKEVFRIFSSNLPHQTYPLYIHHIYSTFNCSLLLFCKSRFSANVSPHDILKSRKSVPCRLIWQSPLYIHIRFILESRAAAIGSHSCPFALALVSCHPLEASRVLSPTRTCRPILFM